MNEKEGVGFLELEQALVDVIKKHLEMERLRAKAYAIKSEIDRAVIQLMDDGIGEYLDWENVIQIGGDTFIVKFDLEEGKLQSVDCVPNFSILAREEYGQ